MTRYFPLCLLMVAVVLQSSALNGQQPRQTPEVTFQVEVNYVDVDVVVTDEQGNFVTGLAREDFEVFEDGKPQKVETFSLVELPVERPAEPRSSRAAPCFLISRATGSRSTDGYAPVLDDPDVSAMRSAQYATPRATSCGSTWARNDPGAVIYTSGRTDAAQSSRPTAIR
jgi:VWFA-related protein